MKAFVTGSHAYGTPIEKSDVDLVVFMSEEDLKILQEVSGSTGNSLRFGNLNLLCVTDGDSYEVWLKGTRELREKAPVERTEAVAHFKSLRHQWGIVFPYKPERI